jgi:hypothetical protein
MLTSLGILGQEHPDKIGTCSGPTETASLVFNKSPSFLPSWGRSNHVYLTSRRRCQPNNHVPVVPKKTTKCLPPLHTGARTAHICSNELGLAGADPPPSSNDASSSRQSKQLITTRRQCDEKIRSNIPTVVSKGRGGLRIVAPHHRTTT